MAETQTWRVVLATGEVREAFPEHNGVQWCTFVDGYHGWGRTPHASICAVVGLHGWPVAEILAPGEATRAELAAQLVAVTAERDALRAEWQRHARGTEDTVRLLLPHTLATARREGAEGMREAADAMVGRRVAAWDDDADEHDDEDAATRWEEATEIRNAIRALPLPGDAVGGEP